MNEFCREIHIIFHNDGKLYSETDYMMVKSTENMSQIGLKV